jgi:type IV pilus assembly protein PilA
MLQALRRRLERDEEGFTLIELMVVVLIIAILLAIAIPTFLGARTKAQDRAAQSSLRNALTAEKTFYTDTQQYTVTVLSLQAIEPSIQWQTAAPTASGQVAVSFVTAPAPNATNSAIVLTAYSGSGTCFSMVDETATGTNAAGTWYKFFNNPCTPPTGAPATAPITKGAINVWGNTF